MLYYFINCWNFKFPSHIWLILYTKWKYVWSLLHTLFSFINLKGWSLDKFKINPKRYYIVFYLIVMFLLSMENSISLNQFWLVVNNDLPSCKEYHQDQTTMVHVLLSCDCSMLLYKGGKCELMINQQNYTCG